MISDTERLCEGPSSFEGQKSGGHHEVVFLNERRRSALAEIDDASFSLFHVKIGLVAGAGFFTDAYDIFAISIAVTMIGFVYGSDVDPNTGLRALVKWQSAGLKVATLVGNLIGQLAFGWLADVVGRKRMYGVELVIMIVATFAQAISGEGPALNIIYTLIVWRFILGIGVGGDYPMSAVIASEFASTRTRGRLMTAVFACQGWGQLAASLVGLVVVAAFQSDINQSLELVDYTWRLLIGLGCIPAVVALYFRLTIPETPRFTMDIDRKVNRAARDIRNAISNRTYSVYLSRDMFDEPRVTAPRASRNDFISYFSRWKNLKVLIGTAYSWFALDVAFYILALDSSTLIAQSIYRDESPDDAYMNLFHLCVGNIILVLAGYIPGFGASFLLIDKWGRKPIQLMGFVVLTILFWIMGFGYSRLQGDPLMALYCLANFFQNFGPNTTTFIIPGEVFPTRYRSTAHGISAASGRLGAVIAQIVFTAAGNVNVMLEVLSFVMMTGVFSTLLIPETKQLTLEELSNENQEEYITGTARVRSSQWV